MWQAKDTDVGLCCLIKINAAWRLCFHALPLFMILRTGNVVILSTFPHLGSWIWPHINLPVSNMLCNILWPSSKINPINLPSTFHPFRQFEVKQFSWVAISMSSSSHFKHFNLEYSIFLKIYHPLRCFLRFSETLGRSIQWLYHHNFKLEVKWFNLSCYFHVKFTSFQTFQP